MSTLINAKEYIKKSAVLEKTSRLFFEKIPVIERERMARASVNPFSPLEDQNKFIFIHVPKNAGNGIIRSLCGCKATGHNPIGSYKTYDSNKFSSYFKFGVVRNPWDRVVSAFHYLRGGGMGLYDNEFHNKYLARYRDFNEFVCALNDMALAKKILKWTHFIPQSYFLNIDNSLGVDYLIRYESLSEGYMHIAKKLGSESQLAIFNKSDRFDYKSYYSRETKEIIRKLYSYDIDFFKYEF